MKLSIITINKNNVTGIEKTIKSVVVQTFTDFEYIIIDGASSDDSVDIIKKYSNKITNWVSEPDTGIYNAMNKGIKKAQGDFCLFLNSGDYLVNSDTLQNVFTEIDCSADIYYSDAIKSNNVITFFPKPLKINHLIKEPISHQNTLVKRSLFLEHGCYNEKLVIGADWEFSLKELWIYKTHFLHIETHIAVFDIHGIGSQKTKARELEKTIIFKNVFGDLADTLVELHNYNKTPYGYILNRWGNTKVLDFMLRAYRFFMCQLT
jgi:glycosyltransferase involved in cell wall biosynthesis